MERFGKYILVDKISSGGMADVYRAKVVGIRGFTKTVAIKRIHPHLLERTRRDRKFLSFHPRLALRSGPFWSPRASAGGWSCLPNWQGPVAGGDCPGTTTSNSAP